MFKRDILGDKCKKAQVFEQLIHTFQRNYKIRVTYARADAHMHALTHTCTTAVHRVP